MIVVFRVGDFGYYTNAGSGTFSVCFVSYHIVSYHIPPPPVWLDGKGGLKSGVWLIKFISKEPDTKGSEYNS